MKPWTVLLQSRTDLPGRRRWWLWLGLFVVLCQMMFYLQILNEHMARAERVRLGQRAAAITPAARVVPTHALSPASPTSLTAISGSARR